MKELTRGASSRRFKRNKGGRSRTLYLRFRHRDSDSFSRLTILSHLTFSINNRHGLALPACLLVYRLMTYPFTGCITPPFPTAFAPNGYGGWTTTGVKIWVTAVDICGFFAAGNWSERFSITTKRGSDLKAHVPDIF